MKKFLLKKIPVFIIFGLLLIVSIALSLIHIKYEVVAPYKINDVKNVISVDDGYSQIGSFNTTSVLHSSKVSIYQYLISKLSPATLSYKSSNIVDLTSNRNYNSGSIQKSVSITDSIIIAYKKAGVPIEYEYLGIIVETVSVYTPVDINVGDVITKVNGVSFNNNEEFLALYNAYRTSSDCYDEETKKFTIPLTINGKDVDVVTNYYSTYENQKIPYLGFYHYDYYKINYDTLNPKISLYTTTTGGPSGGLMQALSIFNQLMEFDYTYGMKIAGTGTIDVDGNVGEIGGMYSKIFTAYFNKVKIFFVPYKVDMTSNYDEAMEAYKALGSPKSLKIVPVTTIDDAIIYLKGLGD